MERRGGRQKGRETRRKGVGVTPLGALTIVGLVLGVTALAAGPLGAALIAVAAPFLGAAIIILMDRP